MKRFFVLLVFLAPFYIYSNGQKGIEYTHLGSFHTNSDDGYVIIPLSYTKPEGLTYIPNSDNEHIIIHNLIIDGKKLRPERNYFKYFMGAAREPNGTADIETNIEESICYINMEWYRNNKNMLYYESLTEKWIMENDEGDYFIPYGTKNVTLEYSIRLTETIFDAQGKLKGFNHHETEKNYVSWELVW
jgi:hypothetical protein